MAALVRKVVILLVAVAVLASSVSLSQATSLFRRRTRTRTRGSAGLLSDETSSLEEDIHEMLADLETKVPEVEARLTSPEVYCLFFCFFLGRFLFCPVRLVCMWDGSE